MSEQSQEEEFDLGLTDEEIAERAKNQNPEDAENAGFSSPEKVSAAGVADEIKMILETHANDLGIETSKIVVRDANSGNTFYLVGSRETGYISVGVTEGKLTLSIPPSFNKISETLEQGANFVFDGGGKAGPRGI